MKDSEAIERMKEKQENMRKKIIIILRTLNSENKSLRIFRNDLVKALSDCDYGKELSVIFNLFLIDDNILQAIYSRIHCSLKEELDKIGTFNIEPYESVANGLSFNKNHLELQIYCSTSQYEISYNIYETLTCSKYFSEVLHRPKRPAIKCLHIDTGYTLKIYISEPYDLHNSEFVNQIKQVDNRVNELMLFLNIWFQSIHVHTSCFMTKYCVTTLIIFYLQNSNPPVLPSIQTIRETGQKSIINGINFRLSSRFIPMNLTQNIHQMIKGFFEFYSSLDFEKVIIAPYMGKVINRDDFRKKNFKFPDYESQMQMLAALPGEITEELETHSPLCVQDMIYLNRNITKQISQLNLDYLKKCFTIAQKLCCDPKISINNLYKSLLVNIIDELEHLKFHDSFIFEIIPQEDELTSLAKFADQPLNLRKLWTKAYIVAIPQIITAVFKIDMTLLPPTENCKFKKFDETEELPLPFKWSISSSVDLWSGRNVLPKIATFMENELKLTEQFYIERRNLRKYAVQFNGFLTITITKNFSSLIIEVYSAEIGYKLVRLRKFFVALKRLLWNYNLKHRINQLESQLQM